MRLLIWFCSLPIFAAALNFALQNRAPVSLNFWPFDATAMVPLSLLSVGLFVFGFIAGLLIAGLFHIRPFFERRALRKQVAGLSAQLEAKEKELASGPVCGPTILSQGRYQRVTIPPAEPAPKRRWFFFKGK